ncbi:MULTISPECIES: tyrosine-type recombinase/integrase [Pandoraea]|uniref:tyrosine-type recombinase/integrase n=1 Tax=Pandoraea TaxID=93217 RepID=UPI001F5DB842|nr:MULTISPECIES: tyrosine-type recombinase/integrase [Pandoraea]
MLIDDYVRKHKARHREKAWPAYGRYAGNALRNVDVAEIDATVVMQVLKHWKDKLHMQRVMRAFLSGFFRWCIEEGRMKTNPCNELRGWLKRPKPSAVYIPDDHFSAIRSALVRYTYIRKGKRLSGKVNSGPMMQCFVDLCYLTAQRSTEIRTLKWSQIDFSKGVIHFVPSKTVDSSGIAIDVTITPEIREVLKRIQALDGRERIGNLNVVHSLSFEQYESNGIRTAWNRAAQRAGLADRGYTVKSIRAKALTDAKRAGYDLNALQTVAAHSTPAMTKDYLKLRDTPTTSIRLKLPSE